MVCKKFKKNYGGGNIWAKKDGEGILFAALPDAIQWAVSGRALQREFLCRHFLLFKLKPMPKRNPLPGIRGGMMLVFCGFFWLLILRVCFPVLQDFLRLLGVPLQAGKHDIGVIGAIVEFIH